jgi:hypothetical protein
VAAPTGVVKWLIADSELEGRVLFCLRPGAFVEFYLKKGNETRLRQTRTRSEQAHHEEKGDGEM